MEETGAHYGYIQDFRMYDIAKYNSSPSGTGVTFTPPTSYVDVSVDPYFTNVALAASFSGTNGQTDITYQNISNSITPPSSSLTAVGDTNYKNLAILSNLTSDPFTYQSYAPKDPIDSIIPLPGIISLTVQAHTFDGKFVIVGDFGYIGISTNGYDWTVGSRRTRSQLGASRSLTGITSYYPPNSTYFYDVVGLGSTVVATGEFNSTTQKYTFFSENSGEDEFQNLWHGSTAEIYVRGDDGSLILPETGGQSIGVNTVTQEWLLANSNGQRQGYGDYNINYAKGTPVTGVNTNRQNWVDYTINLGSMFQKTGKITKVKYDSDKWYLIGYDTGTNSSWYQLGITTSLTDIDNSMIICKPTKRNLYGVCYTDSNTISIAADQFPSRNSIETDLIQTTGIKTTYNTTQTQLEYFEDPNVTGLGTDRFDVGIAASVYTGATYGTKYAPTVETDIVKYGSSSWYFDTDTMFRNSELDISFRYEDFQIEFWFNPQDGASTDRVFNVDNSRYLLYSSNTLSWLGASGGTLTIQSGITTNTWYHVAIARQAEVTRVFWNGVQQAETTDATHYAAEDTYGRSFGGRADGNNTANQYCLDDIRIYSGYCGYTTDFTPPASQLSFDSSSRKDKIVFFSNCESNTEWTSGVNEYYITGKDYGLTNLNNYYPKLMDTGNANYTFNMTTIDGYFKPNVAGIHTFSIYGWYNADFWFDGEPVTSTYYQATRYYTTPSLNTSTYYPIKIHSRDVRSNQTIKLKYINADVSTYTGDFSQVGFVTAGIATAGLNVYDVPFVDMSGPTVYNYRHDKINGIVKGDSEYVYYGDNGFVGYSTDNVTIQNYKKKIYRGIDNTYIGVGNSINDIFENNNNIIGGINTGGYYALSSNSEIGVSQDGLVWESKTSGINSIAGSGAGNPIIGISSSGNFLISVTKNNNSYLGITTNFESYTIGAAVTSTDANFTVTGNTQISTASSAYGGSSAYFDGTSDNLSVSINPLSNIGTGDFTIEGWFNALDTGNRYVISAGAYGNGYVDHVIYRNSTLWRYYSTTASGSWNISNGQSFGTVANDTWVHLAVEKKGSTFRLYKDGVGVNTFTASPNYSGERILYVSTSNGSSASHYGYIQDFRMYDVAKYNSSPSGTGVTFTPPTSYVDVLDDSYPTNVALAASFSGTNGQTDITYQNIDYVSDVSIGSTLVSAVGGIGTVNIIADSTGKLYTTDDSLSGITSVGFSTNRLSTSTFDAITGNTQISTASSAYGGSSAYFDGTSDNLRVDIDPLFNLGTGDFTIEGWFNALDSGPSGGWAVNSGAYTSGSILSNHVFTRYNGLWYYYSSTNNSTWNIASAQPFGTVANDTWVHLAVEKKGSTFRLYRDGVGVTTFTASPDYSGTRPLYIGSRSDNAQSFYGYIQDFRMYNVAKYNSSSSGTGVTFTPPTSYVSAADDSNSIALSAPFNSTYGLDYYESSISHPSFFGNNPVNKFVKTDQYLIGIATEGYVGFTTDGYDWSVSNGFGGNVTDVAYNGISTDPKYTIITENGQIYISGIN